VPLHPIALAIEHKYQGDFRCYTNQTMNDYIKLVCEAAGWRQVVTMKENIGGKTVLVDYPFFEVVSCHTARRTFATMAYLEWKMPIGLCMKITGHKTERQFLDYIKVSKEQAALEMIKYFNY
jgi:integrase